jgi:hypothetical protein
MYVADRRAVEGQIRTSRMARALARDPHLREQIGFARCPGLLIIPIDAKTSDLKRPSKVLKNVLQGVVRMPKKPLSAVRDIKKVVVFPSHFI